MTYRNLLIALAKVSALAFVLGIASPGLAYNEAPEHQALVEAGTLPPVVERLPEEPYVVEPLEEIGRYSGTIRVATDNPLGQGDDSHLMSFTNGLVVPDPITGELKPHFARDIEMSDDRGIYTVHFREGLRWSDGEPFTTEDVMFWYEDILLNEELTPTIGTVWRYDGEVVRVEALDAYTARFTFAGPKPFFLEGLVHNVDMFQPKHYLKEFHPNYVPLEELEGRVREAGFDNWWQRLQSMNQRWLNVPLRVGLPTLNSYVAVEITSENRIYERNPYYWKVDSEGNQLPYIERIVTDIVADREIWNGKIISGELDFAFRGTDIRNFPLYRRYEEDQNYRTLLWTSGLGSEIIYQFNLTHSDEALREIFQDVRFRRAMSLAIDREDINQTIYFGRAQPTQYTVIDISRYHKPEYTEPYIEYDPEQARALLDEMGLEVGPDGYRLRPDGQRLSFTVEVVDIAVPTAPNVELVVSHWQDLGIDVTMRLVSGELQTQRATANLMDATVWRGDKASDILFPTNAQFFVPIAPGWEIVWSTEWARWFQTNGNQGLEPPEHIKELRGWWEEMLVEPDEARRLELADNILASQAENLWVIGTIYKAPFVVIARNTLGNVPEEGTWSWDLLWTGSWNPEQFFFRD